MCQLANQPVLVAVARMIKALRERGSMSTSELMAEVKATKRTFYRALTALKEAGVVMKEGEMYYWYEFAGAHVYESEAEFTLALNHSKNIALGLEHLMREGSYFVEDDSVFGEKKYEEHALTHLRTGYRELYAVFEKAEAFKSQVEQKEKELMDAVKGRLIALSLPNKTLYPENVAGAVCDDIKAALRGHEPGFLTNLRVDRGSVMSGGYTFSGEEVAEQMRDFIREEEMSEENRESGRRIVETENKYYDLQQKLEKKIRDLIMQVKNGTPLQGRCQICPRVKITAPQTRQKS